MNGLSSREIDNVESELIGADTGNIYFYVKNNKTGEHVTIGGLSAFKMLHQQLELAIMLTDSDE